MCPIGVTAAPGGCEVARVAHGDSCTPDQRAEHKIAQWIKLNKHNEQTERNDEMSKKPDARLVAAMAPGGDRFAALGMLANRAGALAAHTGENPVTRLVEEVDELLVTDAKGPAFVEELIDVCFWAIVLSKTSKLAKDDRKLINDIRDYLRGLSGQAFKSLAKLAFAKWAQPNDSRLWLRDICRQVKGELASNQPNKDRRAVYAEMCEMFRIMKLETPGFPTF